MKKKNEEISTMEEMVIDYTVIINEQAESAKSITEEDAALNPQEKPKQNLLEEFINSKPELSRYSMITAFKDFCAKNKSSYNDLKTTDDILDCFNKFFV